MQDVNIFALIFGMMAVTYIPRAIPAVLMDKLKFDARTEKFLKLIPYTAMAALIFPGVFLVDTAYPIIGIAGGLMAAVLALKKCHIMVCVLAAIGVDYALYLIL